MGHFPSANHGAAVRTVEPSIAADGPMAAAVLAALEVPALVLSNDFGDDPGGVQIQAWLERHRVASTARPVPDQSTSHIVIVADDDGTRTWFPYLPGVLDGLMAVDLTPLASASFAYVDCYQLIEPASLRAIEAARRAGVPLLLNLGGSSLSPEVASALRDWPELLVIQTNVDDAAHGEALATAASLRSQTRASWVVVTAGAFGAVALSDTSRVSVPAFEIVVRHTHCAGAAFSGGLLYGLRLGWPMGETLELAAASGSLRCERPHHEPLPDLDQLRAFISSRARLAAPAAG
ncbi:carbohydrate kinase family protein [Frankia sp. B2]|nr:sugar kinase, ribokinase [Frankia sp. BMG5.23]KEZ34264.1 sugar kinase, ribokinase [Frankia sp. CeD]TFE23822.1 carbohydrate kinase family protein [Frankia sp. B2]